MDACLAGPPGDFLGRAFRVSSSLRPLTITPGGEEGLQEHGAQPLLHRCRVSAFSEQGVWLPGSSLDSTIQPPGPGSPHSFGEFKSKPGTLTVPKVLDQHLLSLPTGPLSWLDLSCVISYRSGDSPWPEGNLVLCLCPK